MQFKKKQQLNSANAESREHCLRKRGDAEEEDNKGVVKEAH